MDTKEYIPFSLAYANAFPDNIYTKSGCKVRIICTDRKHQTLPIVGLLMNTQGIEVDSYFDLQGRMGGVEESNGNLVIVKEHLHTCGSCGKSYYIKDVRIHESTNPPFYHCPYCGATNRLTELQSLE